jgi:hypothetical protein
MKLLVMLQELENYSLILRSLNEVRILKMQNSINILSSK